MKMIASLKMEMNNFLKEIEKKTTKNGKKSINPLKKAKKNNHTGERISLRLENQNRGNKKKHKLRESWKWKICVNDRN